MIDIDRKAWTIYDPDGILTFQLEDFDSSTVGFLRDIHPREDLLQCNHKATNITVDFGYYGCEEALDGQYIVMVVDSNLEDAWEAPLERLPSTEFLEGIKILQTMISKYSR